MGVSKVQDFGNFELSPMDTEVNITVQFNWDFKPYFYQLLISKTFVNYFLTPHLFVNCFFSS